jgi:hypothetical protein
MAGASCKSQRLQTLNKTCAMKERWWKYTYMLEITYIIGNVVTYMLLDDNVGIEKSPINEKPLEK